MMQRKDIDDAHVIALATEWVNSPVMHPGVVQSLIDEGVPEKLALAKVLHLCDRGLLEYGTSPYRAWPVRQRA